VAVEITVEVRGVATHPEDDLILATAISARADYLVTGDRQLQALGSYQGVQIVSPRQFLTILQAAEAG
jgi:predicted nucleic acid-binding protein